MITITRTAQDGLSQDVYGFYFLEHERVIILGSFYRQMRATKRHGLRIVSRWSRLDTRDNTISEQEIVLDKAMQEEVMQEFVKEIEVIRGCDRQGMAK